MTMPRRQVSSRGRQHAKEIRMAMNRMQAKTGNMEVVVNEPRTVNVREGSCAASSTILTKKNTKGAKTNISFRFPKVPVRQASQTSRHASIIKRSNAKKIRMSHYNPKVVANGGIRGHVGDHKIGNATVAMKLEEAKELKCVLKNGQGSTISVTIDSDENRIPTAHQQRKT